MNAKIARQIEKSKRRIARRLDRNDNRGCSQPMLTAANIHYEIAERTRATGAGGIGAMHLLVRKLGLDRAIDRHLQLLKIHLPYHESDHVLNIAYNILAGGTCLEHLEWLRSDEAYLDALGARRIPDPTTAGDFCRRFDRNGIDCLQDIFNAARRKVWRKQPDEFFEETVLDGDGTMSGVRSLTAPVDTLLSNWAYMVMASLAWSLKAWAALLLPDGGRWKEKHREEKRQLLRMEFATFRRALLGIPAQIVKTGRKIVYRLLNWNPWQHVFFRLLDQLREPLRC